MKAISFNGGNNIVFNSEEMNKAMRQKNITVEDIAIKAVEYGLFMNKDDAIDCFTDITEGQYDTIGDNLTISDLVFICKACDISADTLLGIYKN